MEKEDSEANSALKLDIASEYPAIIRALERGSSSSKISTKNEEKNKCCDAGINNETQFPVFNDSKQTNENPAYRAFKQLNELKQKHSTIVKQRNLIELQHAVLRKHKNPGVLNDTSSSTPNTVSMNQLVNKVACPSYILPPADETVIEQQQRYALPHLEPAQMKSKLPHFGLTNDRALRVPPSMIERKAVLDLQFSTLKNAFSRQQEEALLLQHALAENKDRHQLHRDMSQDPELGQIAFDQKEQIREQMRQLHELKTELDWMKDEVKTFEAQRTDEFYRELYNGDSPERFQKLARRQKKLIDLREQRGDEELQYALDRVVSTNLCRSSQFSSCSIVQEGTLPVISKARSRAEIIQETKQSLKPRKTEVPMSPTMAKRNLRIAIERDAMRQATGSEHQQKSISPKLKAVEKTSLVASPTVSPRLVVSPVPVDVGPKNSPVASPEPVIVNITPVSELEVKSGEKAEPQEESKSEEKQELPEVENKGTNQEREESDDYELTSHLVDAESASSEPVRLQDVEPQPNLKADPSAELPAPHDSGDHTRCSSSSSLLPPILQPSKLPPLTNESATITIGGFKDMLPPLFYDNTVILQSLMNENRGSPSAHEVDALFDQMKTAFRTDAIGLATYIQPLYNLAVVCCDFDFSECSETMGYANLLSECVLYYPYQVDLQRIALRALLKMYCELKKTQSFLAPVLTKHLTTLIGCEHETLRLECVAGLTVVVQSGQSVNTCLIDFLLEELDMRVDLTAPYTADIVKVLGKSRSAYKKKEQYLNLVALLEKWRYEPAVLVTVLEAMSGFCIRAQCELLRTYGEETHNPMPIKFSLTSDEPPAAVILLVNINPPSWFVSNSHDIEQVVKTALRYPQHRKVQGAACSCLYALAGVSGLHVRVVVQKGLRVVRNALGTFVTSHSVCYAFSRLISLMFRLINDNSEKFFTALQDPLYRVLESHSLVAQYLRSILECIPVMRDLRSITLAASCVHALLAVKDIQALHLAVSDERIIGKLKNFTAADRQGLVTLPTTHLIWLLCCHPDTATEDRRAMVRAHAIKIPIRLLVLCLTDSKACIAAFRCISVLVVLDDMVIRDEEKVLVKDFSNPKGVGIILQGIMYHSDEPHVALEGVTALGNCCAYKDLAKRITNRGIDLLFKLMQNYKDKPELAAQVCRCFGLIFDVCTDNVVKENYLVKILLCIKEITNRCGMKKIKFYQCKNVAETSLDLEKFLKRCLSLDRIPKQTLLPLLEY